MMCFTNAQFWRVLCVCQCVCVSVCVCGAEQPSQQNTNNSVTCALAEVCRYIFVMYACVLARACVCVRSCVRDRVPVRT